MAYEPIDAPVLAAADDYTAEAASESSLPTIAGNFLIATAGAIGADAYNSTGAIANFLGGDGAGWHEDTHSVIAGMDADAADFYTRNKGLVDGVELMATSLIPGTLGIKALRLAQNGAGGSRILSTLGLAHVNPAKLNRARTMAADKALEAHRTWNTMNGELGKALALGVFSNTLDMAAFGAGAMALTNSSPMYDGMSATDLIKNTLVDALFFGGVVGGAFSAAKTYAQLYGARAAADKLTLSSRTINTYEDMPAPVAIAGTIVSYNQKLAAAGGVIADEVTSAVKATVNAYGRGLAPEADKALSVSMGRFAEQLIPDSVAATNFFGKLKSIGRRVDDMENPKIRTQGDAVYLDVTDGKLYARDAQVQQHLGDMGQHNMRIQRGGPGEVVLVHGSGKAPKVLKATSNIDDAVDMQASYFLAATERTVPKEVSISIKNLPMAERAIEEATFARANGLEVSTVFRDAAGNVIQDVEVAIAQLRNTKINAIQKLHASGMVTPEDIATRLNVPLAFLENPEKYGAIQARSVSGTIKGMQSMEEFLVNPRIVVARYDMGMRTVNMRAGGTKEVPATVKRNVNPENVFKDTLASKMVPQRIVIEPVEGATTAIYEQQAQAYIANVLKVQSASRQLVSEQVIPSASGVLLTEEELSAGMDSALSVMETQTMLKSANNPYGVLGSMLQKVGSFVNKAADEARVVAETRMIASANALAQDVALGREWIAVQNKLGLTAGDYVLDPMYKSGAKEAFLVRQDIAINAVRKAEFEAGKTKKFIPVEAPANGEERIAVSTKMMESVLLPHAAHNTEKLRNRILMDNEFMPGSSSNKAIEAGLQPMYRIPVDTSKLNHFLFVLDANRLVGSGSGVGMMFAKDAEQLAAKRAALESQFPGRFDFKSKSSTAEYYKAAGEYQYARGLNESFVDSAMRRAGVLGDVTPNMDPKAVTGAAQEFLAFHQRLAVREVRDAVEMRYSNVFGMLDFLGKNYEELATSRMASKTQTAIEASSIRNPYRDVKNMALDIGSANEFPLWTSLNAWTEKAGDSVFGAVSKTWESLAASGKVGVDFAEEAAKCNAIAERAGLEPLYSKVMAAQWKDQLPTRPVLRQFISKTQATLNGLMLGFDPMQAANNALGQVMFAAEFRSLISMIEKDAAGAGLLKGLTKVQIPGMEYSINSAIKLHAQSTRRFFFGGQVWDERARAWKKVTRDELLGEYKQHNLVTDLSQQYHQMIDDLTVSAGTLTDAQLGALSEKILAGGRKITGNRLAEEYTRFVAADAARQLTDAAMAIGKIESKAVASVYWNTAVNRVHGVNIASQRAVVFQGVIGQSMGMFMTYQHNLMQQLFRYAANGDSPAMIALGVSQLGLYGVQGLPAFNTINTYLIGNAYGNTRHDDLYTHAARNYGGAAEWVLYGLGSNALGVIHPDLKVNLYSRGDINPRQLTVFPTSLENTVAYSATVGAVTSMLNVLDNISQGAPVAASVLHGLEHNNINRPLSGLAAVFHGTQTSAAGSFIAEVKGGQTGNWIDKLNVSNFMRIAGAKPLDDAAAADAMYRSAAYKARDTALKKDLAETMRLSMENGTRPTPEEMISFQQEYAKRGGNYKSFNAFATNAYKSANTNQVVALAMKQRDFQSRQVADIMGAMDDRAWLTATGQLEEGEE